MTNIEAKARKIAFNALQFSDRALEICSCKSETQLAGHLEAAIATALRSARDEALEEAAKAVEKRFGGSRVELVKDLSEQIAFRIRSLAEEAEA